MKHERLKEFVDIELQALESMYADIIAFPAIKADRDANNYDKAAIALMLAQFYNGVENILKRTAEYHGIRIMQSDQFHVELLKVFNNTSGNTALKSMPEELNIGLTLLRRFRHYVFHGYSFRLEWDRLMIAINSMSDIFSNFKMYIASITNYDKNEELKP